MSQALSGATRVHFIVGDPIAQVKSPAGVTQAFQDAGRNAVCVPAHVSPADLAGWAEGVSKMQNVDGIIVTVPHKFSCFDLCATTSDRGSFLKAVNTLRRNADGSWHGDMFDGVGYVEALKNKGCEPQGQRALLVGAGGAGSTFYPACTLTYVLAWDDYGPVYGVSAENGQKRPEAVWQKGLANPTCRTNE